MESGNRSQRRDRTNQIIQDDKKKELKLRKKVIMSS